MAIRNTDLTRDQFKKVTEQWIKDNPEKWADLQSTSKQPFTELQNIIEEKHGRAIWRDRPGKNNITGSVPTKSDPGVPFIIENKGGGRIGYKSKPTRKATRGQAIGTSSGTRGFLQRAASKPGTDFHDANRAMGEANAINMDGGHITPLKRKVAGQEFKVQSGRGTVQQMNQAFDNAGIPYGHTRANIEPQDPSANRVLQSRDYARLDASLKKLSQKSPVLGQIVRSGKLRLGGYFSYIPDFIDIADSKTGGAVTNGINNGINTALDPVRDLADKAVNNANGIVKQFIDAYASLMPPTGVSNNDYGQ